MLPSTAICGCSVEILEPFILHPFPDIAVHFIQSPRIRRQGLDPLPLS